MTAKTPDASLLYLTINNARQAKRLIRQRVEADLDDNKAVPLELLSNIDKQGNTLVELSQRLKCSKQEMTRLVQQAVDAEWVETCPSPTDSRAKLVRVSAQGRAKLNSGLDLYRQIEIDLLEGLDEREQKLIAEATSLLNRCLVQALK